MNFTVWMEYSNVVVDVVICSTLLVANNYMLCEKKVHREILDQDQEESRSNTSIQKRRINNR